MPCCPDARHLTADPCFPVATGKWPEGPIGDFYESFNCFAMYERPIPRFAGTSPSADGEAWIARRSTIESNKSRRDLHQNSTLTPCSSLLTSNSKQAVATAPYTCFTHAWPGPEIADNRKVWYNSTDTEGGRREWDAGVSSVARRRSRR